MLCKVKLHFVELHNQVLESSSWWFLSTHPSPFPLNLYTSWWWQHRVKKSGLFCPLKLPPAPVRRPQVVLRYIISPASPGPTSRSFPSQTSLVNLWWGKIRCMNHWFLSTWRSSSLTSSLSWMVELFSSINYVFSVFCDMYSLLACQQKHRIVLTHLLSPLVCPAAWTELHDAFSVKPVTFDCFINRDLLTTVFQAQ